MNLQPGRISQARAKAEEQSLRCVCVTEITPSILGNSFSEKRSEPLDFIRHSTGWGTVLCLGFPASQGDVNTLILVVGTVTPGTLQSGFSVCSSRAYGRRGLL